MRSPPDETSSTSCLSESGMMPRTCQATESMLPGRKYSSTIHGANRNRSIFRQFAPRSRNAAARASRTVLAIPASPMVADAGNEAEPAVVGDGQAELCGPGGGPFVRGVPLHLKADRQPAADREVVSDIG